jgi:hypothetical protein
LCDRGSSPVLTRLLVPSYGVKRSEQRPPTKEVDPCGSGDGSEIPGRPGRGSRFPSVNRRERLGPTRGQPAEPGHDAVRVHQTSMT